MGFLNSLMGIPDPDPQRRPGSFLLDLVAAQPSPSSWTAQPGGGGVQQTDGLHPLLQKLQNKLPWLDVVSGLRSNERQQELWQQALAKYGDPEVADNWVARPGTSNHEKGFALDVAQDDIDRLVNWLANHPRFGSRIGRPMDYEPWHFEIGE